MEQDCNRAIEQINEKMYVAEYEDDYDEILCYGISFFKKRCFVKRNKNEKSPIYLTVYQGFLYCKTINYSKIVDASDLRLSKA